jgi:hypothetical protein
LSEVIYRLPVPCNASGQEISKFAENLREESNLKNGFQVKPLIEVNGGRVDGIDACDVNQEDALIVQPGGDFVARYSRLSPGVRNNFILAHELGHFVLHWPKVKETFPGAGMRCPRRGTVQDKTMLRCEQEADLFAVSFLLPEKEFREAVTSGGAREAADRFAVSFEIVEQRAQGLGIEQEMASAP